MKWASFKFGVKIECTVWCVQISAQANKQAKTNTVSLDSRLKKTTAKKKKKKKKNETAKQHQKQTD